MAVDPIRGQVLKHVQIQEFIVWQPACPPFGGLVAFQMKQLQ
jgi:hypothetical protein